MDQLSLDNILVEKEPPEVPVEEVKEEVKKESDNANIRHKDKEEAAVKEGKLRDESGKFVKEVKEAVKEEVVKEVPKQEFSDKEKALLAAAQDERRKRQDLERRLQEAIKDKELKKPEKPFWEAPEEHFKAVEEQHKSWEQKQQERETVSFLRVSELMSRQKHPDFDEKVEYFGKLVTDIPGLYQKWMGSPDPGEFAYKTAKEHKDLQEAGNIDNLRAQIQKEERIKLEAELKEKASKLEKEREALPGTLSDARGTKQQKTVWGGPTTLDDVLKG